MPAANRYTTTEFLAQTRRLCHAPSNQSPYQDADLLAIGDDELELEGMAQILSTRENFYLVSTDVTPDSDGTCRIPTRAIADSLADVQLVVGNTVYSMPRTEIGELFSTQSSPLGFYSFSLQSDAIVVLPVPTIGVVRLWYYRTPNKMVATTAACQVTAVASNVLTFASIPSTITTSTPCDIIKDQPHFGWHSVDVTPTVVTSTQITFSSVPTYVAVGDWVSLAGQTPVPQCPKEYRGVLAQRVAVKVYELQGNLPKMEKATKALEGKVKAFTNLINPRVAEEPKRIVPDTSLMGGYGRFRTWPTT